MSSHSEVLKASAAIAEEQLELKRESDQSEEQLRPGRETSRVTLRSPGRTHQPSSPWLQPIPPHRLEMQSFVPAGLPLAATTCDTHGA